MTQKQGLYFSMPSAQEMQQLIDFCKIMATAPFYQRLQPGGIMAIYLTAKEHNVPFMAALNGGMHTFDGKVTFSAQLINAMIIAAGHRVDVLILNDELCRLKFIRNDRKEKDYDGYIHDFTTKQAEKAGYLSKANWKSSLKDMLFSRCLTGGGRKHIPEVFVGVLVSGELVGDDSDSNIIPQVPLSVSLPVVPENKKPLEIELKPVEGYMEFMLRHDLYNNSEGKPTRKYEFVLKSAEKAKIPEMKLINIAIGKEQDFIKKFEKWESENYPEREIAVPRSMDELAMLEEDKESM